MEVEFWESDSGHSPARIFIKTLNPKTKRKVMWWMDQIEERGLDLLATGDLKKLSGVGDIYELRVQFNKQAYRLLGVVRKSTFWILHAFTKKSQETPQREIITAKKRSGELDAQLDRKNI